MADAAKTMSTPPTTPANPIQSALIFATEAAVPGLSHVVKGDLVHGATYGLAGLFATLVFGMPGRVLVGTTSFLKSAHNTDLLALLRQPAPPAPSA